ncbi:uncharacterized protein LOC111288907 [Durio zibethinus]|uniref:RING-type E3 ubiquitin transferase n=1 Tax=Durio zibethinus TaxID=66656 RepID=A0A6P5Y6G8_DURZI|nr:uncharacterized protein LOC111288907 [Durio zibethinus]
MSIKLPSLELSSTLNRPFNQSSNGYREIQISAEGFYDAETGNLCMVGCRELRSENKAPVSHSMDCEILVDIHFPPLNSDRKGSKIKGSIKSMRETTDHLYFEPMYFSGRAHYRRWAVESIWRMDFEVVMSVISNTFATVFVVLQIFHVRKHPGVCPFVSLLMLVILASGHLIPLVLNLETMSFKIVKDLFGLEVEHDVLMKRKRPCGLLRSGGLYACFPVYIAGAVIAFFVKWRKNLARTGSHSSYYIEQIILGGSRAYAGLILDAFLFPQILFNMFQNSKEQALSRFFYIGITLVRLEPHGYDLYRAHNYVDVDDSYINADPAADYYSTAWNIIIPVSGLFFAAIIHLQQRFGGGCFLPKRFQESVIYEDLPVASEEQLPLKSST